jgi:hypothetical protein
MALARRLQANYMPISFSQAQAQAQESNIPIVPGCGKPGWAQDCLAKVFMMTVDLKALTHV